MVSFYWVSGFFWENLKVKGLSKTPKTSKTTRIAANNGGEREREREREREIYRIPLTSKTEGTEERSRGQA
jgi:hypothetical protein